MDYLNNKKGTSIVNIVESPIIDIYMCETDEIDSDGEIRNFVLLKIELERQYLEYQAEERDNRINQILDE